MNIDELIQPHLGDLKAYEPGKPIEELERELGIHGAIKVASNENPMGPSPRALEAARRALEEANQYPDGGCYRLRNALAERRGIDPGELVFGGGSNEIIYLLVHVFCRPGHDEILTHQYAFISYRLAAGAYGIDFVAVPVSDDLSCNVDALIDAITPRTKLLFLANPNNPTGAHVPRRDFERLVAALPEHTLLVVDEAYHEYATALCDDYPSSAELRTSERPGIVTLRTFSKIHGLAGMRIGYGIADARVVRHLERVRRPFNVNRIAQAAALAALDDAEHIQRSLDAARHGIAELRAGAEKLGLRTYPSAGNFLLVDVGRESAPLYDQLLHRGVIARPMAAWGLPHHLRISVGAPDAIGRIVDALAAAIGS